MVSLFKSKLLQRLFLCVLLVSLGVPNVSAGWHQLSRLTRNSLLAGVGLLASAALTYKYDGIFLITPWVIGGIGHTTFDYRKIKEKLGFPPVGGDAAEISLYPIHTLSFKVSHRKFTDNFNTPLLVQTNNGDELLFYMNRLLITSGINSYLLSNEEEKEAYTTDLIIMDSSTIHQENKITNNFHNPSFDIFTQYRYFHTSKISFFDIPKDKYLTSSMYENILLNLGDSPEYSGLLVLILSFSSRKEQYRIFSVPFTE